MAKNIDDLNLDVKTFNRLKKAGINTTDELLSEMYKGSSDIKVSAPDAKRCEEALKAVGIIKYVRGDYVTEDDIESEPLTWDELHNYIGKLVVHDLSTESHRWLKVCWIYDIQDDGEGNLIYSDGSSSYGYVIRSSVNGEFASRRSPFLKYEGQFFALKTSEVPQEQSSPVIVESAEYTNAVALHRKICVSAELAEQNRFEMCKGLCEMRDKQLYRELGCQTFEEYCKKELKISDRQGRKYAAIASLLTADRKSTSGFEKLGTEKLYLLSRIEENARIEIMGKTNLENTAGKELKAEIDKLKGEQKGYKERQDKLLTRNKELVKELEDSEACRDKLSSDLNESRDTVMSLERQIEELENKPVDVYENTAKINELTAKITEMEVENAAKLARLKSEYEGKTAGEPEVCRAVFQAYLTSAADALHRLCDFAEEHKPSEEFNYYIARINKLISCAESETARIGGK